MKYTLNLKPVNGGPFNNMPAREVELEDKDILANDVTLPWDFNPHNTRLWVIGNEFGALFALWSTEHELLDTAVDLNRMDSFTAEDDHRECEKVHTDACAENCTHDSCEHSLLGNASEPFDLTYCWYQEVDLSTADTKLLCALAETRGNGSNNLSGYCN